MDDRSFFLAAKRCTSMHALSNITIPGTANKYSGQPAKKMPEGGIYRRKNFKKKKKENTRSTKGKK